jgi:hypothetical protein
VTPGEIVSIAINIAVGIYFIHYFPRNLKRKIPAESMPPFFAIMLTIIPLLGYLLLAATLIYIGLDLELADNPPEK